MISAEEARIQTEEIQDSMDLECIEKEIILAINNGAMFCKLNNIPNNNVYMKLKDLGYEIVVDVERHDSYSGYSYTPTGCTISWYSSITHYPWYVRQFKEEMYEKS